MARSKKSTRVDVSRHSLCVCTYVLLRSWYYHFLVHSPLPFISTPARAYARSVVRRVDNLERTRSYYDLERKTAARYCKGKVIDVGCGSRKTVPSAIGVDLTKKGSYGFAGSSSSSARRPV